jgi:D-aminopeptidase
MADPAAGRAAGLGIEFGALPRARWNAITDVPGVRVGHATLIRGEGPLIVGDGPVRTGVTIIRPHDGDPAGEPLYAGFHRLNGNGEVTGVQWIEESGLLTSDIAITNTHSVGTVRDALVALTTRRRAARGDEWFMPVVGETWDGLLSDIGGQHVRPADVEAAWDAATTGPVAEGSVGGGTGMICHGFKGGIGTSSRIVRGGEREYTVGVLLQANHGRRERLTIAGHPVGQQIGAEVVPLPDSPVPPGSGSVVGIVATDAPLLPHQCRRLAQRVGLGIARSGGTGEHTSGDLFLAFSTAGRGKIPADLAVPGGPPVFAVESLRSDLVGALFDAVIEATEESVVNALLAARTMTGRDGITAHALPHDLLRRTVNRPAPH